MAVEILEAMDESVVARKSVEIIMQYLRDFRASNSGVQPATPSQGDGDGNGNVDPTLVGGPEPGSGLQTAFDIPVCFFFLRIMELCICFANCCRNGRMGLDSRIIRSMGLHGFLMIWGVFLCWIIDFTCIIYLDLIPSPVYSISIVNAMYMNLAFIYKREAVDPNKSEFLATASSASLTASYPYSHGWTSGHVLVT